MTPEERAARNAAMVAAAATGVPRVAIAEQFGLSLSRTSVILGNAGAPPPAHGRGVKRDLDYRGYREKYEAGATIRALAEAAGVGFGTMHRGLELAGTTFRPSGGRGTQT